jgi:hypothetical protein
MTGIAPRLMGSNSMVRALNISKAVRRVFQKGIQCGAVNFGALSEYADGVGIIYEGGDGSG